MLVPNQPADSDLIPLRDLEAKPVVCNPVFASPTAWTESRYSSYRTLLHVTAWSLRMSHNLLAKVRGHTRIIEHCLSPTNLNRAETFLFTHSQTRSFKHPRILSSKDHLIELLFNYDHQAIVALLFFFPMQVQGSTS